MTLDEVRQKVITDDIAKHPIKNIVSVTLLMIAFIAGIKAAYNDELTKAIFWGCVCMGETIAMSVYMIWKVITIK